MKTTRKGIPKIRVPEELEGIVKKAKITYVGKSLMFVETKRNGSYILRKENSRIFNHPTGFIDSTSKVLCCFHGNGKELYFPYKVCDLENKKIYYQER